MPGHRLSTRLPDYDYRFGAFFFSLVAESRERLFGEIINNEVRLSPEGCIVMQEWLRTPMIRQSVQLDEWVVMPDHFQAIAFIDNGNGDWVGNVGVASWRPCQSNERPIRGNTFRIRAIQPAHRSLARIISQFKATTTRRINEIRHTPGQPIWQRGYHDRIIRNEIELDKTRQYIRDNPRRWHESH